MKKRNLLFDIRWRVLMLAFLGLMAAACDDDDERIPEPTILLSVSNQFIPENNGMVVIDEVTLDRNAWIAIRPLDLASGTAGPVVGVSDMLTPGTVSDVMIDFNEDFTPTPGQSFVAVLHNDTGQEGVFEFSGAGTPDQPILNDVGSPIALAFTYTLPADAARTIIDMEEVNDSGVTGRAVLYDGMDDVAWVILELNGTTEDVMHPAHMHSDADDALIYELEPVNGTTGFSITSFDNVTYEDLVGYDGYIEVHLSPDDETVVSIGNTDED